MANFRSHPNADVRVVILTAYVLRFAGADYSYIGRLVCSIIADRHSDGNQDLKNLNTSKNHLRRKSNTSRGHKSYSLASFKDFLVVQNRGKLQ